MAERPSIVDQKLFLLDFIEDTEAYILKAYEYRATYCADPMIVEKDRKEAIRSIVTINRGLRGIGGLDFIVRNPSQRPEPVRLCGWLGWNPQELEKHQWIASHPRNPNMLAHLALERSTLVELRQNLQGDWGSIV
jgi:hypothetical protein